MKKQNGFTLIELVVVIVILGILAVTAAPKFLNLQDDARTAAAQGLRGSIVGAASMVYGKASIDGIEKNANGEVSLGGETITVAYGYPKATYDNMKKIATLENDWHEITDPVSTASGASSTVVGIGYSVDGDNQTCHVVYAEVTEANKQPVVSLERCEKN